MHAAGDILAGRYRIEGILGTGGMGGVYHATQMALDKPFAIKENAGRHSQSQDA